MDSDETDPNKLVADLARLQEKVTGLSDENLPSTHITDTTDQVTEKFASAKKVMELLDRMRPKPNRETETQSNFDTPETSGGIGFDVTASNCEIPQSIGRFQIQSLLGQGGFSLVFKALDPRLDRMVALKIPTLDSMLNADSIARFEKESRALAGIVNAHTVQQNQSSDDAFCLFGLHGPKFYSNVHIGIDGNGYKKTGVFGTDSGDVTWEFSPGNQGGISTLTIKSIS